MIKELTNVAKDIIENLDAANKDKLTESEIKELAIKQIRILNYGKDKKSYFWITDLTPVMIMHPYRKDLDGINLSDYKDINGVELFNNAVKLVKKNGEGFLEYNWQWQDDSTKLLPKIAYVKLYKKWGWIIGTGVYVDDIETELSKIRKGELKRSLFISIPMLLLIISIVIYGINSEKDRKKALHELELSEEKFRNLFQNSNDIIILCSLEGVILDINEKTLITYDLRKEDILGKTTFELIPEKYHEKIRERIRVIDKEELEPIEVELTLIPNKKTIVEVKSNLLTYEGKTLLMSTMRDITERKLQEQKLISAHKSLVVSEAKFKNLSNLTFEGIALHDKGVIMDANLSLLNMFGYTREELVNKHSFDILFDKEYHKILSSNIKNNVTDPYEVVGVKKDGTKFPVEVVGKNYLTDLSDKSLRVTALRDITLRKKAESEIRKLSTAVEQSANLIIITDIEGTIEYANEMLYRTTGYTKEEVIGKTPRILKSGKQDNLFYENLWKTILTGNVWKGEICNRKKNGELYWESTSITPIIDYNNKITNFMSVKEDITEKKLADIKLFNTILETEERERKKFAEDLHDELGPHLSGIRLYINELEDEKIKPERRVDIVNMLDVLVKEAIDKTRSISNQLMPSILTDYGLIKALNSFCSRISNTNAIKITLDCNIEDLSFDETTEIVVYRVLIELINNTLKHANARTISIKFDKDNEDIELVYKDDGQGFDLNKEIEHKKGLGLSNVINRIKTLEGSYHFESYPKKGIIFSFTFRSAQNYTHDNKV